MKSSQPLLSLSPAAPQCLIDATLRNLVLSHADAAVAITMDAAHALDVFIHAHLGGIEGHSEAQYALDAKSLVDLRKHPHLHTKSSIRKMVAQLRYLVTQMTSKKLATFAVQLHKGNVLALHKEAPQLFRHAREIYEEVLDFTASAEVALACCSLSYVFESDGMQRNGVWLGVVGVLLFGGLVAIASSW